MHAQTLVLWDVDHTLIETGGIGFELFRAAFEKVTGQPLAHPAEVTGRTEPAIFKETLALHHIPCSPQLFDRYAKQLAAEYHAATSQLARRGRALPGAAQAIAALAQTNTVVQSVLTGNLRPVAETKLKTFGLHHGLDLDVGAYGTDDDVRARLVPVACRRACAKYLTVFPTHTTVLIGDTPSDIQAAHESGARIIAIASGKSTEHDLRQAGATLVFPSLNDTNAIVAAVTKSNQP